MTNYKETITNELKSHRDSIIQSLTVDICKQYADCYVTRTIDSFAQSMASPCEWTMNWTYDNKFFDVEYDPNKRYEKKYFHHNGEPHMVTYRKWNGEKVTEQLVRKVYDYTFTKKFANGSDEVIAVAKELATEKVDNMLAFYEKRLHQKLDDTNEAQPITKLEIVSFDVESVWYPSTRIIVEVKNGAKCELTTKVVWKVSERGNSFFQMPTTFHNAFDPKGRKVARPSFDAFAYAVCDNKEAYDEVVRLRTANEKLDKEYARVQERFQKKLDFINKEMRRELEKVEAKRPVPKKEDMDCEKGRKEIAEYISSRIA